MADSGKSASGGIGFVGLLQLMFIGLKLGKVIDWSWWWVMSPFLAIGAILLGVVLIVGALYFIAAMFDK